MEPTPKGLKHAFRNQLGINLSNPLIENKADESQLQEKVKNFLERDDVTRTCPDRKKTIHNPAKNGDKVPARYRLSTIACLHIKFLSEEVDVTLSYFNKCIPYYVVKPNPNDWGDMSLRKMFEPGIKVGCISHWQFKTIL